MLSTQLSGPHYLASQGKSIADFCIIFSSRENWAQRASSALKIIVKLAVVLAGGEFEIRFGFKKFCIFVFSLILTSIYIAIS